MASPGHTPVHTRRGYYCSATRPRGSTVEHEVHLSAAARAARGLIHKVSTPLRFDATMAQPVGIGRKSVIRSPLPTTAPPGNPDVSKTDRNVDQEHFITASPYRQNSSMFTTSIRNSRGSQAALLRNRPPLGLPGSCHQRCSTQRGLHSIPSSPESEVSGRPQPIHFIRRLNPKAPIQDKRRS